MNTYEQMFLDDVRKLKGIIGDLLEEQIDNNDKEPEELKEIRKVIDFGFHITAYCNFETKTPVLSGRKNFHSIDEYYNREDYDHCTHDVDWDEEFDDDGYFKQFQYSLHTKKHIKRRFPVTKISYTPLNLPPAFIYSCQKRD